MVFGVRGDDALMGFSMVQLYLVPHVGYLAILEGFKFVGLPCRYSRTLRIIGTVQL
jgi:hypothetical protein